MGDRCCRPQLRRTHSNWFVAAGATNPLPGGPFPFYMLIETSGSHAGHDKEKLDAFLTYAMEEGLLEDGTVAESSAQSANVWRVG